MTDKSKRKSRRSCLVAVIALIGLCLLLSAASALSNIGLPAPQTSDRFPEVDKARLAEALHLKAELGNQIWPGWGGADMPVIVWNSAYEFLFDYPGQPPAGWELVPDDTFNDQPYYRRPAENPQNFTMPVGDLWAASMATKVETDAFLIGTFRDLFPTPIKQIFPYRLLIQPSETQIGGLLHESFHAYVMQTAPERLNAAEDAYQFSVEYNQIAETMQDDWKNEAASLAQALQTETNDKAADLVRQFLAQRAARRQAYDLNPDLISYERQLEWEEGLAKYVEIASLRQASQTPTYTPLPAMQADPYFKNYKNFDQRWSQELIQLRNPSGSSDTRFYMSGMAEAFLLDRLMPGWKNQALNKGIYLEDLLRQAVGK